jgi:hypothetical protein
MLYFVKGLIPRAFLRLVEAIFLLMKNAKQNYSQANHP